MQQGKELNKYPSERQNVEVDHNFNTRLAASGGYALSRCARNFGHRSTTYQGMNEIKEAQSAEIFKQTVKDYLFEIFQKYTMIFSFLFNYHTAPSIFCF